MLGGDGPPVRLQQRERFARQMLSQLCQEPAVIAYRQDVLEDLLIDQPLRERLGSIGYPRFEAFARTYPSVPERFLVSRPRSARADRAAPGRARAVRRHRAQPARRAPAGGVALGWTPARPGPRWMHLTTQTGLSPSNAELTGPCASWQASRASPSASTSDPTWCLSRQRSSPSAPNASTVARHARDACWAAGDRPRSDAV